MKYISDKSNTYVDQGNSIISKKILHTCCLGSCSALYFHLNGYNFLSHIDGLETTTEDLITVINSIFSKKDMKNYSLKGKLIIGPWCADDCKSANIGKEVIKYYEIQNKIFINKDIQWKDTIIVSGTGINL